MSELVKEVEHQQKENISSDEEKIAKCYLCKNSNLNCDLNMLFAKLLKHRDAGHLYFYNENLDMLAIFKIISSMVNYYY